LLIFVLVGFCQDGRDEAVEILETIRYLFEGVASNDVFVCYVHFCQHS